MTWLASLSESEAEAALYAWHDIWARDSQQTPEGDWQTWLILAGRGWGKTKTGAEWIRDQVESGKHHGAIVAATAADVRDTLIEGESGLLNVCPPWNKPVYIPSRRRVQWPNGAYVLCYSAKEPDRLRGGNHQFAWADELAVWRFMDAYDQLMLALRSGDNPQLVITTTPRPIPIIKQLIKDPTTHLTVGSTYENQRNLAKTFFQKILAKYKDTRLGLQELEAKILDDSDKALWKRGEIDEQRVTRIPDLIRVVVAVDPAGSSNEDSADTGIVVAGIGEDGHGYVLEDCTVHGTPHEWASAAVSAYHRHHADLIIAEKNQGGDMVESTVRTVEPFISYQGITAKRGKYLRAEPVSALYQQKRVHHLGMFGPLEDQMCNWEVGEKSPDRLDALVHAITALMLEDDEETNVPMPVVFYAGQRR